MEASNPRGILRPIADLHRRAHLQLPSVADLISGRPSNTGLIDEAVHGNDRVAAVTHREQFVIDHLAGRDHTVGKRSLCGPRKSNDQHGDEYQRYQNEDSDHRSADNPR